MEIFVKDSSMAPIVLPGDRILSKKIRLSKIKPGDLLIINDGQSSQMNIVVYKKPHLLIVKNDYYVGLSRVIKDFKSIEIVYAIFKNGHKVLMENIYISQSVVYFSEIKKVKNEFENNHIDYVFLKGLPLHLYYEKSYPKRIYADCDILIAKNNFQKVENIITKLGYKKSGKQKKHVENNYFKDIDGFHVVFDIHLEPAFLMTQFSDIEPLYKNKLINELTSELLKTKQKVKIHDENCYFLSTNFQILYLALHFFHHNFQGSYRLDFLDKIIRKNHLKKDDWAYIANKLNQFDLSKFVYPAFVLLQKYYHTPFPDNFILKIHSENAFSLGTINRMISKINIFNEESRLNGGIQRFKLIFLLSPQPLWKKLTVFFNPRVILYIFLSFRQKLFSFFLKPQANSADPL